jgi:hypothetical protein
VRGKRKRSGGASLRLLTRTGGWPTAASDAVALAGAAAARLREEEDALSALGWSGLKLGREMGRLREFPRKRAGISR